MRSNLRLVSLYLLGMMLVNFYGNLGVKPRPLRRDSGTRQLWNLFTWIPALIRNVWFFFWNIILGVLHLIFGFFVLLVGIVLFAAFCHEKNNDDCESYKIMKDGWGTIKEGGRLFADGFYSLILTDEYDQVAFNEVRDKRKKTFGNRLLSQTDQASNTPFNCNNYPEQAPYEVLAKNLADAFQENINLVRLQIKLNEINLFLRQGYKETPAAVLELKDRKDMYENSLDIFIEVTQRKVKIFRSRLKRSVCASVRSFNEKLDKTVNPEKWEGDQKKKFEKLKVDSKSADNKTKQKADKEMAELMKKFDIKNEDFKKKMGDMLMAEFKEYYISKDDLSSQFTIDLIRAAMMQLNKDRSVQINKSVPASNGEAGKIDEWEKSLEKVNQVPLKDDSIQTVLISSQTEDEGEEKAKDQL